MNGLQEQLGKLSLYPRVSDLIGVRREYSVKDAAAMLELLDKGPGVFSTTAPAFEEHAELHLTGLPSASSVYPPKLPLTVWDAILAKTDAAGCLAFNNIRLAMAFIKDKQAAIDQALQTGNLHAVRLLMIHKFAVPKPQIAAAEGMLQVVGWLHQLDRAGYVLNFSGAVEMAAENGHLKIVQFLLKKRRESHADYVFRSAAVHGHLNVVQWLIDKRLSNVGSVAMIDAAGAGQLEVIKYIHERDPGGKDVCNVLRAYNAAKEGNRREVGKHLIRLLKRDQRPIGTGFDRECRNSLSFKDY